MHHSPAALHCLPYSADICVRLITWGTYIHAAQTSPKVCKKLHRLNAAKHLSLLGLSSFGPLRVFVPLASGLLLFLFYSMLLLLLLTGKRRSLCGGYLVGSGALCMVAVGRWGRWRLYASAADEGAKRPQPPRHSTIAYRTVPYRRHASWIGLEQVRCLVAAIFSTWLEGRLFLPILWRVHVQVITAHVLACVVPVQQRCCPFRRHVHT